MARSHAALSAVSAAAASIALVRMSLDLRLLKSQPSNRVQNAGGAATSIRQALGIFLFRSAWLPGGEGGIRTRGGLLTLTRFPGVRLKPLIHLSCEPAIVAVGLRLSVGATRP